MILIKCFLCIVLQLIIIEPFINAKALGRNVVDTAFCPTSRKTGGSTWLLHGMPPKCYVAGSKGPCDFNQVFIPKSQDSYHGQCMALSHDNIPKLNSGDREQDISQKFVSYNRIKRQITTDISDGDVNEGGEPSYPGPGFIGKDIQKIECRDDEVWSELRKRCVRIFSCGIC